MNPHAVALGRLGGIASRKRGVTAKQRAARRLNALNARRAKAMQAVAALHGMKGANTPDEVEKSP